jgi:DNA polymerase I
MRLLFTPQGPYGAETDELVLQQSVLQLAEPKVKGMIACETVIIDSQQSWVQALRQIQDAGICGLDLETTGLDPLVARVRLAQLAIPGTVFVADVRSLGPSVLDDLVKLLENEHVKMVIHNAKFELSMIQASHKPRLRVKNIFCTMLASQVCWSGYYNLVPAQSAQKFPWKRSKTDHTLRALAQKHLGMMVDKSCQTSDWSAEVLSPEQLQYAARDAEILLPLQEILQELLGRNGLEHIAEMEFRALTAVVELELTGLPIDSGATRGMMEAKNSQIQALAQELQEEALRNGFVPRPKKGKSPMQFLNLDSHHDILDHMKQQGYKISSTKEENLKALDCPWAKKLLEYRRVSGQQKFLQDWLLKTSPVDGRLHAQYFQLSTVLGRISSGKPNAQQIPKRGADGQAIRKLFRAPPGRKIVKADFAGIELRIMARLSGDKTMTEAFKAGQDLHKITASKMAGVPLDQVSKEQRQAAKGVNFGLIYGASPVRFQAYAKEEYGVDMSIEEAKQIRRIFFSAYPGVANWHRVQRKSKFVLKAHYLHDAERGFYRASFVSSRTVLGRKRIWGCFQSGTLAKETELYNTPSQGTGADLIKMVLAEVFAILNTEVKLIGCVHDEIILEAPEAMADEAAAKLKEIMERIGSELLKPVPVVAEVDALDSWGG